MRPSRKPLALACLAALLAACGGGTGDGGAPLTIVERSPAAGAVDASATSVVVEFSEPMDPASLAGAITVSPAGGAPMAGAVSASGALAQFTPDVPFPAAASLQVTVSAEARAASGASLGAPASWSFQTAHWRPVSSVGTPTARSGHTAVWTGTEMIVWGGTPATLAGGRYDPAKDTWAATSTSGAPAGRTGHSAVWTGSEMIVWGGTVGAVAVATGGRYDPATNTWRSLSPTNAPTARSGHTAVWTGTEMIVWGGAGQDLSGARYDPATDTWTPTSLADAPIADLSHRAVWTGARMAVWGLQLCRGCGAGVPPPTSDVGGLYDPATDTWTAITTSGAPGGGSVALAWSGSELLAWCAPRSGGRYTPASDAWIPMAEAGAPADRWSAHFAWTGSRLLVWSGLTPSYFSPGAILGDGALFDPATDAWTPVSTVGSAAAQQRGAASVWTGAELVVWGGEGAATGARFTP